jgi:hypothetical protein
MARWVGQRMKAMQPVSPAAHNHQLTEPRSERGEEAREGLRVVHSAPSLDDAIQDALPDDVRLFAPPRRV